MKQHSENCEQNVNIKTNLSRSTHVTIITATIFAWVNISSISTVLQIWFQFLSCSRLQSCTFINSEKLTKSNGIYGHTAQQCDNLIHVTIATLLKNILADFSTNFKVNNKLRDCDRRLFLDEKQYAVNSLGDHKSLVITNSLLYVINWRF